MITCKFTFTAGVLIRKQVVSEIRNAAFRAGVNIKMDEDSGWLDSNYRVTLSGEENSVLKLKKAIYNYFEILERED